jgi:hypothetical protein
MLRPPDYSRTHERRYYTGVRGIRVGAAGDSIMIRFARLSSAGSFTVKPG